MTKKNEEPTPPPEASQDHRDIEIQQLQSQLKSMENFANIVVEQRNNAQNEAAQYRLQLIQCMEGRNQ